VHLGAVVVGAADCWKQRPLERFPIHGWWIHISLGSPSAAATEFNVLGWQPTDQLHDGRFMSLTRPLLIVRSLSLSSKAASLPPPFFLSPSPPPFYYVEPPPPPPPPNQLLVVPSLSESPVSCERDVQEVSPSPHASIQAHQSPKLKGKREEERY
jgi:hypothetical protein